MHVAPMSSTTSSTKRSALHIEVLPRSLAHLRLVTGGATDIAWWISIRDLGAVPLVSDAVPEAQQLYLEFDDTTVPQAKYKRMTIDDMRKTIEFCRRVDGPTLVNCEAGVSRSSAIAIVLNTIWLGPGTEAVAVNQVMSTGIEPDGTNRFSPNRWIIRLADDMLNRGGRLEDAVAQIMKAVLPCF